MRTTIYVLSRYKKNNVYPWKPQFYYIKVGFEGSKLYRHVFVMIFYFSSTDMCFTIFPYFLQYCLGHIVTAESITSGAN